MRKILSSIFQLSRENLAIKMTQYRHDLIEISIAANILGKREETT